MSEAFEPLQRAAAALSGRYGIDFRKSCRDGYVEVIASQACLRDVRDDLADEADDVVLWDSLESEPTAVLQLKPGDEQLSELLAEEREARPDGGDEQVSNLADRQDVIDAATPDDLARIAIHDLGELLDVYFRRADDDPVDDVVVRGRLAIGGARDVIHDHDPSSYRIDSLPGTTNAVLLFLGVDRDLVRSLDAAVEEQRERVEAVKDELEPQADDVVEVFDDLLMTPDGKLIMVDEAGGVDRDRRRCLSEHVRRQPIREARRAEMGHALRTRRQQLDELREVADDVAETVSEASAAVERGEVPPPLVDDLQRAAADLRDAADVSGGGQP